MDSFRLALCCDPVPRASSAPDPEVLSYLSVSGVILGFLPLPSLPSSSVIVLSALGSGFNYYLANTDFCWRRREKSEGQEEFYQARKIF